MIRWLPRTALLLAALALTGCVTTKEEADLIRSDVAQLQAEVSAMKREQNDKDADLDQRLEGMQARVAALETTLHGLRQADADSGVQMEKVIAELQILRGDIEATRYALGETQEAVSEAKRSVKEIMDRPPIEVQAAQTAPKVDAPEPQKIAGLEVPAEKQALYEFALTLHKEGNQPAAVEAFELFCDKFPDDAELIDNAWFWTGESYYQLASKLSDKGERRNAYKKAILAYNKVIEIGSNQGKRSNKEDGALFKIGMTFEALGYTDEPKAFYEEILSAHAKSPLAAEAKKRLDALEAKGKDDKGKKSKKGKKRG